jgi:hypothetical protein
VVLLNHIYEYLANKENNRLIWLHGTAGVGKSAVAFTVAEKMRSLKMTEDTKVETRLGGTFFFSRKHTKRRTAGYFFTTLAYQLAINFPSVQPDVNRAILKDPSLLDPDKSLRKQMEGLFLPPLRKLQSRLRGCPPLTFVIDALDECAIESYNECSSEPLDQSTSKSELADLMSLLGEALREPDLPVTHILLTSRSEEHIRKAMQTEEIHSLVLEIPVKTSGEGVATIISLDGADVDNDIYVFLKHSFKDLESRHPDFPQPSMDQLTRLAIRAGRRFIVASTMVKFIDNPEDDPRDRLQLMLELTSELLPGTEVYKLYDRILSTCADSTLAYLHLSVVAALADPLPVSQISKLLGPSRGGDVESVLIQLRSIIDIPADRGLPVSIYHSSVRDYVSHRSNCGLRQVQSITSPQLLLAYSSLRLMIQHLSDRSALLDALSTLKKQGQAMEAHDLQSLTQALSFIVQPPEPMQVLVSLLWLRGNRSSELQFWLDTLDGRAWLKTQGGKDWLLTQGGKDWLPTLGGKFWLQTDVGEDWMQTQCGQDWLQTQREKDWLQVIDGYDFPRSLDENDRLHTLDKYDWLQDLGGHGWLQTWRGKTWLQSQDGGDWLQTQRGEDWLQTQGGKDWLRTKQGRVHMEIGDGVDLLQTQRGDGFPQTFGEKDWPQTQQGNDLPQTFQEKDWLQTQRGDDLQQTFQEKDWLQTQMEDDLPQTVREEDWLHIQVVLNKLQTEIGKDWLQTEAGKDWLRTGAGKDWLQTEAGKDWLQTQGGSDWLQTQGGTVWLQTYRGNNWLQTQGGKNWLQTQGGSDWLQTRGGNDWLQTEGGMEWLQTLSGHHWLHTQGGRDWLNIPSARDWLQSQGGMEWLQTCRGNDWLQTQGGKHWLQTQGNDWLQTQGGNGWLQTQGGNAWLQTRGGNDWLQTHGGTKWLTYRGNDWLQTQGGKKWLQTRGGNAWLQTQGGTEWLQTCSGNDWLQTQGGKNWLQTQGGNDWLQTQEGNDWLQAQGGMEWLHTLSGHHWLHTQGGRDWLKTPSARDWLQTPDGRDWLQTPHGQMWRFTTAWVTMEEFANTLEAIKQHTIVPELLLYPACQVIQQFKSLPNFLMFPAFLALRYQDHSASALIQNRLPPDMKTIHAMKIFCDFANKARERSQSAPDVLNYACQNWAVHISRAPNPWDNKLSHIFKTFWDRHLLDWLERQWCTKGLQSCLTILSEGEKHAKVRVSIIVSSWTHKLTYANRNIFSKPRGHHSN